MRLLGQEELLELVEALSNDDFCASIADIAEEEAYNLTPSEKISTYECAVRYRYVRTPEGSKIRYDPMRNPYNIGPMNSLDDAGCTTVVVVKPSRSGGTTIAENHLFKMMKIGPMGDVGWYLGSDTAVKQYCDRVVKPMFEDHPELQQQIGKGRSDNNDTSKRIGGSLVEWLPANDSAFRNREFVFGVADEPDGWQKKYSASPVVQLEGRQKQVGKRAKRIVMSHPDKGWAAGTANAWETTSRGIFIMRCVECSGRAAAHATKFWKDIPEFKLSYTRLADASQDERIAMAENTAGMACPHCGALLTDEQRFAMIDEASLGPFNGWMHRGQTLDQEHGIQGEMEPTRSHGYWQHGLMLKVSTARELAKSLEEAIIKFERSGGKNSDQLKEVYSKLLGEIFEGKNSMAGLSSSSLQQRAKAATLAEEEGARWSIGWCPPHVKFITAAVDVGIGKFDVGFWGWDLEGRSWLIDRMTIKQRRWSDGVERDIRTRERIEDWMILEHRVVNRRFPIMGEDNLMMPVAVTCIDVGDGNVTWKGREYARRSLMAGSFWGRPSDPWAKVRLIQGSSNAKAPELPLVPTKVDKDEHGAAQKPIIVEYTLGVHKLKELSVERLAVDDGGPGYCMFADGISSGYFDEFFNERLIDGKWERNGPNETLDLFGYAEAGRQMLKPDRKDIDWSGSRLPPWAKPIPIDDELGERGTLPRAPSEVSSALSSPVEEPPKKRSVLDRVAALNVREETKDW